MIIIVILLVSVMCFLVWNVFTTQYNKPEPRKLIDISSGHGMFVAGSEREAIETIQSKSDQASDGDICYVRYCEGDTVKTIAGIYSVADESVSITYLR